MANKKYFTLSSERGIGFIKIHHNCLEHLVISALSEIEGVSRIFKTHINIIPSLYQDHKDISIYLSVNIHLNTNIVTVSENIQKSIKYYIETLTQLKIDEILIKIVNID